MSSPQPAPAPAANLDASQIKDCRRCVPFGAGTRGCVPIPERTPYSIAELSASPVDRGSAETELQDSHQPFPRSDRGLTEQAWRRVHRANINDAKTRAHE